METNRGRLFLGLVLLLVGGFLLAVNLEFFPTPDDSTWAIFFGAISLLFFAVYFSSGVKNWGWLFPAMGTGAIAALIWVSGLGLEGEWMGSLFMYCIAVPFVAAYFSNTRENWWALIPSWVMIAIGTVILLSERVAGEVIGALVMFSIGLPFFVVYFRSRENWWALIPAGVMSTIGVIVLLSASAIQGEVIGGLINLGIGLVFLILFLARREQWWALIPAGALLSVGVSLMLVPSLPSGWEDRGIAGLITLGLGVTFGILWTLRGRYRTQWAGYPAVGLLAFALLVLFTGTDQAAAIAIILVGLWILLRTMRQPSSS